MLSQLGFEHDVACHRWEELFDDQAPSTIVSAQVPEAKPARAPVRKPETEPAVEEEPVAPEVAANELARLRRRSRIAITVSIVALLALPFACAL